MRHRPLIICLALVVITFGLYAPALHFQFLNFDDQIYVTENPHIQAGLKASEIGWAFTSAGYGSNWHPLTWLSHMLDCQLFGLSPSGPHAINILFHVLNTALLFFLLLRLTGSTWRSALVAALFAWHPQHVESVAWISERKDVLSAFFFLLTLLAYTAYCRESKIRGSRVKVHYGLALVLFACGLMAKPMLVTVPLVMLLLDFWPLQRINDPRFATAGPNDTATAPTDGISTKQAILEKIPFFGLAIISGILTIVAQHAGGSVASLSRLPIVTRVTMALVSYCRYIWKAILPEKLSAYYPPVPGWPSWIIFLSGIILMAATTYAWSKRKTQPYFLAGWLWFLVMLVPVIGLVQVGTQAMADRYTYLPAIGLFVAAAWELGRLARIAPQVKNALSVASAVVLAICLILTRNRIQDWQDSGTLFAQSLRVAPANNFMAHALLGSYLNDHGHFAEATPHFEEAIKVAPTFPIAQLGMGNCRLAQGNWTNAAGHFTTAIECHAGYAAAYFGRGSAYMFGGIYDKAAADFEEAIRLKPDWPAALNNAAWVRATAGEAASRNGEQAVKLAERACQLTNNRKPLFLGTLAAAYAEAGRFKEAVATAEQAKELASAAGEKTVSEKNLQLLELYRAGKPFHETPAAPNAGPQK